MINSGAKATSTTALIFKWTGVGVNKYTPCLKCVMDDYKNVMGFFRSGTKKSMFIKCQMCSLCEICDKKLQKIINYHGHNMHTRY